MVARTIQAMQNATVTFDLVETLMRPFRSVLYMPGSNARALEKAKSLPADALILDMEDAVAPDAKPDARKLIVDAVNDGGLSPRFVLVRTNAINTAWGPDDIAALGACSPDALLLPKVDGPNDMFAALDAMDEHPSLANAQIWAMMETPASILNAAAIAGCSDRLGGFVLGTNDLIKDMRARNDPSRQAVLSALTTCVLAARANDIAVIDGVYNAIKDEDGLRQECDQGKTLGFDGKSLIHPAQIAPANDIFGPSEGELDEARLFVSAFDDALAEGKAVAVVNGRIVENLHVENATRLLKMADAISELNAATGAST